MYKFHRYRDTRSCLQSDCICSLDKFFDMDFKTIQF